MFCCDVITLYSHKYYGCFCAFVLENMLLIFTSANEVM